MQDFGKASEDLKEDLYSTIHLRIANDQICSILAREQRMQTSAVSEVRADIL